MTDAEAPDRRSDGPGKVKALRCCFLIEHIGALGGTERAACQVMTGLAERGGFEAIHLLEVFPVGPAPFPFDPSIRRAALSARKISVLGAWPRLVHRLRAYVRMHAIDVLIVVESTHALYAIPALAGTGVRCVVWEHFNFGVDLGRRPRRWGRRVAGRWADDVVTLTQRDITMCRMGIGTGMRAHLTAISNAAPPVWRTAYPVESRVVLAVGRLVPQKGYDRLIEAWRLLARDPALAAWRLAIVGDGPLRGVLERQIADAELGERIELAPATVAIETYYARAALYCCASRFEGFPMVLLEAAAAGVPAVAFNCETGPSEIIIDGESGVLVPQGDVAGLAGALRALMTDPVRRARLSVGARKRAEVFALPIVLARWYALLGVDAPATRSDVEWSVGQDRTPRVRSVIMSASV
ncbi:glycosyltransferase family 4 protein [Gluconacetobacter diazotrophicus]|uniref:glycosyltransferase family 4 protein n=1 Tax=Gluconacetobacter diazotrophicus TaxID=33996 RepID=UPI00287B74E1|nr:glycosyltransferase family 4 protein [Gluconacetobacter diazotrophicus]